MDPSSRHDNETRWPELAISTSALRDNARAIASLCASRGVEVWGVTKCLWGPPELARIYFEEGFAGICDSRVANIEAMRGGGYAGEAMLIRIAMPGELGRMLKSATISMQSDVRVIRALDELASATGARHKILLAIDAGDLREGFWPDEIAAAARELRGLRSIEIVGVASNFACASGVMPTPEKFELLTRCRDEASRALGRELPMISAGGTVCLKLLEEGAPLAGVNSLRCGEGVLFGHDGSGRRDVPGTRSDTMTLTAEIVECRSKPSMPSGELGAQAMGAEAVFVDKGIRRRALLAIGRADCRIEALAPLDDGVEIITASSDHMIVDVTEAELARGEKFSPGDTLSFRPSYASALGLAGSRCVRMIWDEAISR